MQYVDPLSALSKAETIKSQKQANQLGEMRLAQTARDVRDKTTLRALMPQAMSGDKEALSKVGEIDYDRFKSMNSEQLTMAYKNNGELIKAAQWADTPEKWDQAINFLESSEAFPGIGQFRGRFDLRESAMNSLSNDRKGMTEYQRQRLARDDRQLGMRESELAFRRENASKVSLTPTTQKILDKAQEEAFSSGEAAREMELLARDIGTTDIGAGTASTFTEKLKQVTGSEEAVSELRRRFRGFRSSQAVNNLPPGVASDKDIELALSGFPGENANAQTIQGFLRGQAKLARLQQAYNTVKSELISEQGDTRGLTRAWKSKLEDAEFISDLFGSIEGINSVEDTSTVQKSAQQPIIIDFNDLPE